MNSSKKQNWLQAGFSMVEVTVAMGLLGIAAVAVMNLTDNINTNTVRAEASVARTQFASSLGSHLASTLGCNEIINKTFSTTPSSPSAINLTLWKLISSVDKQGNKVTTLRGDVGATKGTEFRYFRIKSLTGYVENSPIIVKINNVDHTKANFRVALTLNLPPPTNRDYDYFYNIPVLTTGGTVRFCNESKSLQETCLAMKGKIGPTGQCELDKTCKVKGTYQVLSCSPSNYGCSNAEGTTRVNSQTGGTSCPSGAVSFQTGSKTWNHTASCGKKCTATIVNNMNWYSCLECPP